MFFIQAQLNNAFNFFTRLFFNQIIYKFNTKNEFFFLTNSNKLQNIPANRILFRQKTANVITFANAKMKSQYDINHQPLLLKSKNKTFFKFNSNYFLFDKHNKKLFQQRCDFFVIKQWIKRLTYELKLSSKWKIHSIISIIQLKLHSDNDSYNRFISIHSDSVYVEKNTLFNKLYEVKKIMDKRIKRYNKIAITQYLIRWLNYGPEYDEWKFIPFFQNC